MQDLLPDENPKDHGDERAGASTEMPQRVEEERPDRRAEISIEQPENETS